MITEFKIFEKLDYKKKNKILSKLMKQFDDNFIEEYYDENYAYTDPEDVIFNFPNIIWYHFDDEKFIKDFIYDEKNALTINEFSDYDYKKYIINNNSDEKIKRILKIYKKENDIPKDEEGLEYDDIILDDLTEKQLKNIILKSNEEEEFLEYTLEERYEDRDAKDILSEFYDIEGDIKNIYDRYNQYIDEDAILKEYNDNETFDNKYSTIKDHIDNDRELQDKLLEINKSNVLLLAKILENNYYKNEKIENIANEYDFQKLYIEQYVDKNKEKNTENNLRAKAIKFLYKKFELNPEIEDEYSDDMWMITMGKFNL